MKSKGVNGTSAAPRHPYTLSPVGLAKFSYIRLCCLSVVLRYDDHQGFCCRVGQVGLFKVPLCTLHCSARATDARAVCMHDV